jgi:hypothetical protein
MDDERLWAAVTPDPGLCRDCRYPFLNETRRGTVYLRCTRAAWDERLNRYPRLPVGECVGFDRRASIAPN